MKSSSSLLARVLISASLILAADRLQAFDDADKAAQTAATTTEQKPCRWWQFGRCDQNQKQIEGLPDGAPHTGTVITVDLTTNKLYLFQDAQVVDQATVATGSEKILKKGRRVWLFHTPRGAMKVLRKVVDPVWTRPDWAFIEAGDPVPPPGSPKRQVRGHLGKYALDLGDGIMIHGTDDASSFGRRVSHGCIRVPAETLENVYKSAKVGTPVYIFESAAPAVAQSQTASNDSARVPEHHSDLDYLNAKGQ